MHACTFTNQATHCCEYSSLGLVMVAQVCKANSPLPPAGALPKQEQEHPWGVSKFWGAQLSPASCRDCVHRLQTEAARGVSWRFWKWTHRHKQHNDGDILMLYRCQWNITINLSRKYGWFISQYITKYSTGDVWKNKYVKQAWQIEKLIQGWFLRSLSLRTVIY